MSIRSLWLKTSKQESVFVKYVSFCIISSAEESWFVFPWAKYNLSSGEAHQHRDSVRKELKTGRRRGRRYKKLRRWRLNRLQEKKVGRIIIAPFFCFYLRLKEGFFLRINWIPQLIRFPHRRLNTNCTVKKQSNGLILTDCCRDLNQQPSSTHQSHTHTAHRSARYDQRVHVILLLHFKPFRSSVVCFNPSQDTKTTPYEESQSDISATTTEKLKVHLRTRYSRSKYLPFLPSNKVLELFLVQIFN